ncbi:DNA polymerase ligase N-terminal domain-containing protein [Nocardioides sp. CER19]|uniref:non-homologous end-joining DNA ligase LigD n=1 Tax=Nocardioides sp. CER19 TaxID=3038538 RepID=UPI002449F18A|nr:DNA polymerase ligase N-terminal domain-containing protein [Nocardioides sp. CER19]MDH2414589.1 DNA polymerase ligase N-terminal domain-containing protein [Nocardioides sp. CER19]
MTADPLEVYRRKRDFTRTREPRGATPAAGEGRRFVVQRHRARRLHYDLRFEIDGVLVSWAVPKGPTLDPSSRRLAVHVEDHPIEYLTFEGVIPHGEYGGGDVIVWDLGTWEPVHTDDPAAAVRDGELHAEVHGDKLHGRLVLVRRDGDEKNWMLLHKHDDHAVDGWDPEDHPRSVTSGRTNDEVKADPDRLWRSDAPAAEADVSLLPEPLDDDAIDALGELGKQGTWEVFGRSLKVTNLDKVLFPAPDRHRPPVTKRELLAYTARIAPVALPYLEGRALNLHRYPDGADKSGFWHKQRPSHAPEWVGAWANPDADPGETDTYVVVDEPAALVWAANFGALEWHPWTSRTTAPHEPSYALVDLDPGERTGWDDLLTLARLHRTALEHLGVTARAKVTGRRGIQIWIPVVEGYSFDDTRAWVEKLSRTVGKVVPELVSWKWEVKSRGGLARLDYTQNAINKTLVAPYSPRPAPGAPVSVPIGWDELDDPELRPDRWTIRTVLDRLAERGDPFRAVLGAAQELPEIT